MSKSVQLLRPTGSPFAELLADHRSRRALATQLGIPKTTMDKIADGTVRPVPWIERELRRELERRLHEKPRKERS